MPSNAKPLCCLYSLKVVACIKIDSAKSDIRSKQRSLAWNITRSLLNSGCENWKLQLRQGKHLQNLQCFCTLLVWMLACAGWAGVEPFTWAISCGWVALSQACALVLLVQTQGRPVPVCYFCCRCLTKDVWPIVGAEGNWRPKLKGGDGPHVLLEGELQHAFVPAAGGCLYRSGNWWCSGHWFKWIFFIL